MFKMLVIGGMFLTLYFGFLLPFLFSYNDDMLVLLGSVAVMVPLFCLACMADNMYKKFKNRNNQK